jgi:hypothetical protein
MGSRRLEQALADLDEADRHVLIEQWRRVFKIDPPRHASMEFLRRALAYRAQKKQYGGLSPALRRELLAVARDRPSQIVRRKLKPGVRLLREWHGATHEVIVTDTGFFWEGRTYKSLSAVAHEITGAKWNGHRFFGLLKGRGKRDA